MATLISSSESTVFHPSSVPEESESVCGKDHSDSILRIVEGLKEDEEAAMEEALKDALAMRAAGEGGYAALKVVTSVNEGGVSGQRYIGTIKIMNNTYGFIKVLNNGTPYDVFVHANNIAHMKGEYKLKKRDVVSFHIKEEMVEGVSKHVAADVTLIQEGPANTPVAPPAGNSPTKRKHSKQPSAGSNSYFTSPRTSDASPVTSPTVTHGVKSANNTPVASTASSPRMRSPLNPEAPEFRSANSPVMWSGHKVGKASLNKEEGMRVAKASLNKEEGMWSGKSSIGKEEGMAVRVAKASIPKGPIAKGPVEGSKGFTVKREK